MQCTEPVPTLANFSTVLLEGLLAISNLTAWMVSPVVMWSGGYESAIQKIVSVISLVLLTFDGVFTELSGIFNFHTKNAGECGNSICVERGFAVEQHLYKG